MSSVSLPSSSEGLVSEVIDNGRVSGQQILVIGLCLLLNMLDGFDITAMAIVGRTVATELMISNDRLGWIFSFALAGMMAGAMFLAPVSDRIGRRKVIIMSGALVGVSILLTANATTLYEFFILRFISGVGAGAMLASQATLAAEYSPEKYRALSVTAVTAGYPLGAMLTSVVAAYIMPDLGLRGSRPSRYRLPDCRRSRHVDELLPVRYPYGGRWTDCLPLAHSLGDPWSTVPRRRSAARNCAYGL
jgi:MFS family permease